jgi:hypothetical protein
MHDVTTSDMTNLPLEALPRWWLDGQPAGSSFSTHPTVFLHVFMYTVYAANNMHHVVCKTDEVE